MESPLIDGYINWLESIRDLTKQTITHHRSILQAWERFLQSTDSPEIRRATADNVLTWIEQRRTIDKVHEVTIGDDLCILRMFYDYLIRFVGSSNPIRCLPEFICKSQFDRGYLAVDEVFTMLESLDTNDPEQRRDYVIIALLWSCGLRTGELLALQWRDIDLKEATLLVRNGKGRKQRQLFLNDRVLADLQQYRKGILGGDTTPVFCRLGNAKKTATPRIALDHHELTAITKSCGTNAGIKRSVTPMLLRHTFATHMYEAGIPIRDIQEMMGHSDQTETTIYIHVTLQVIKKLLNEHVVHTMHQRGEE
jgi:site-specific recombinase XerD